MLRTQLIERVVRWPHTFLQVNNRKENLIRLITKAELRNATEINVLKKNLPVLRNGQLKTFPGSYVFLLYKN